MGTLLSFYTSDKLSLSVKSDTKLLILYGYNKENVLPIDQYSQLVLSRSGEMNYYMIVNGVGYSVIGNYTLDDSTLRMTVKEHEKILPNRDLVLFERVIVTKGSHPKKAELYSTDHGIISFTKQAARLYEKM
ncbi:hypothetical protein [Vibrio sinus]|uniref:hypothetical protein n=1 Tax=Vibrio sinus TaxID=2946865 RepID=UPI003D7E6CB1